MNIDYVSEDMLTAYELIGNITSTLPGSDMNQVYITAAKQVVCDFTDKKAKNLLVFLLEYV